jgi:hypothetical protein
MLKVTIISLIIVISPSEYELKKIYSATLSCSNLYNSIIEFKNNKSYYKNKLTMGYICEKGEL